MVKVTYVEFINYEKNTSKRKVEKFPEGEYVEVDPQMNYLIVKNGNGKVIGLVSNNWQIVAVETPPGRQNVL